MWDGENERKAIVMHGKENHNQITGWCSLEVLEYVLYYKEGKTIGIQKYILIVRHSNVIIWNIEAADKIDSSSFVLGVNQCTIQ
jgi:hypothetical protein